VLLLSAPLAVNRQPSAGADARQPVPPLRFRNRGQKHPISLADRGWSQEPFATPDRYGHETPRLQACCAEPRALPLSRGVPLPRLHLSPDERGAAWCGVPGWLPRHGQARVPHSPGRPATGWPGVQLSSARSTTVPPGPDRPPLQNRDPAAFRFPLHCLQASSGRRVCQMPRCFPSSTGDHTPSGSNCQSGWVAASVCRVRWRRCGNGGRLEGGTVRSGVAESAGMLHRQYRHWSAPARLFDTVRKGRPSD